MASIQEQEQEQEQEEELEEQKVWWAREKAVFKLGGAGEAGAAAAGGGSA